MKGKKLHKLFSCGKGTNWVSWALVTYTLGCFLFGQGTGQISGRVETEQGDPVQQATVVVFSEQLNLRQETTTTAQGSYSFSELPSGTYRVEAMAEGYNVEVRGEIDLSEARTPEVNFRLSPVQQVQDLREVEARGEEQRNPNIFIKKIDLNALRDPLRRQGVNPVFLEFSTVNNLYGADFGAPLRQLLIVRPSLISPELHGSIYEAHQNSAANARPFFNVGPLRPSRRNQFGFSLSGSLVQDRLFFTGSLDMVRESGFVNGNIRVPLPEERTPTSSDPLTNQIVAALLTAYPEEDPNLPDVTARQLNTNAERDIDSEDWTLKLDYLLNDQNRFAFQYALTNFSEDPFELVIGENPQTDLRSQSFSATYVRNWSPAVVVESSFYFDRLRALLVPTESFRSLLDPLGLPDVPDIDFGGDFADLTPLGPGTEYPRERFQNRFAGQLNTSYLKNQHHLRMGGQLIRLQLNDLQSDNTRGRFVFSQNFGRTAIENFLNGTPTKFTITQGDLFRGFRHWEYSLYVQDTYQARPGLTFTLGLRYEVLTAPTEVNNLTDFSFDTDANNFAPQIGFAWNPGGGSVVVRGGYGISFGQFFPGTYQLQRFNPPAVRTISVQNPSLVDPLQDLDTGSGEPERSELSRLSSDLVTPYAHQYNLLIEKRFSENLHFRVGYVGSRTLKLFFPFISNRAEPFEDPDLIETIGNIDERRPDHRFFSIKTIINSGMSYYDALKVGLEHRLTRGLALNVQYVFSKDLTSGYDFAATLNREIGLENSQNNADFQADLKGPTAFDRRHAFSLNYSYDFPFDSSSGGLPALLFGGWTMSGTTALSTGVWFDVTTSSDSPGFGNVDGEGSDRPNINDPIILGKAIDDPDTSTSIFRAELFNSGHPSGRTWKPGT